MANTFKKDFPIFKQTVEGKPLVYLDNAATTQKPEAVIEAVSDYYRRENANPHRGAYSLSVAATEVYESAREKVRDFIGAKKAEEIIFTRGTTESINLVAYCYGMNFIAEGDEIVLSIAEHHSNLVPWQQVAKAKKAKLVYMYTDEDGRLSESEISKKITAKTKLVAIAHVSNVLGTVNPVREIIEKAHSVGAVVMLDMAQSVAHMSVDVTELDADFAAFSGHKMFAPMGIGVLYGKAELLDKMPPFNFGGDMIEYVEEQDSTFAPLPQKFEGGTQNVGGAAGLSAAIDYIRKIGFETIQSREEMLTRLALERLSENEYVRIIGSRDWQGRAGVISFVLDGVHPHDIASILDADGVCVRSGHHCAHTLMSHCGVAATCRMSLCFYNDEADIEQFAKSLAGVRRWLIRES